MGAAMKILCIGDVHGKTIRYQKMIRQRERLGSFRSIQLGDMGIGFKGVGLHKMPETHTWIRGNHDNPEKCRQTTNYQGDWGFLYDTKVMYIGGAYSIDAAYRIPGVSWWPDEELAYDELQAVMSAYEEFQPDYVLTHECPARVGRALLDDLNGPYFLAKTECCMSRTAEAFQQMLQIHQPKEWAFGHYHINRTLYLGSTRTKFTCVAELSTYELEIA